MLPSPSAGNNRIGQNQIQRLRFSDRNEIHGLQMRFHAKRSANYFYQPRTRHIKNERRNFRRSIFWSYSVESWKLVSEVSESFVTQRYTENYTEKHREKIP